VSINRPGDLDLRPLTFLPLNMTRVMDFHPPNFGLPRPFRSRVMSRHDAIDRRTDRRTDNRGQFKMPPRGRGIKMRQSSYFMFQSSPSWTETDWQLPQAGGHSCVACTAMYIMHSFLLCRTRFIQNSTKTNRQKRCLKESRSC